jgi:hypothetical protein
MMTVLLHPTTLSVHPHQGSSLSYCVSGGHSVLFVSIIRGYATQAKDITQDQQWQPRGRFDPQVAEGGFDLPASQRLAPGRAETLCFNVARTIFCILT